MSSPSRDGFYYKRQAIYDNISRVLTNYEDATSARLVNATDLEARELYEALVEVQNEWDEMTTRQLYL